MFNQKTIAVVTDDGYRWRISPHLLKLVKGVKPEQAFIYYDEKQKG